MPVVPEVCSHWELGSLMPDYRAYVIGPGGHIMDRIDLFCPDDERAKESGEKLVDGRDIELWHHERKIAEFKVASNPDHSGGAVIPSALTIDQLQEEIAKQIELLTRLICEEKSAVEANAKLEALTRELLRLEERQDNS
jgi:hypothetical protein